MMGIDFQSPSVYVQQIHNFIETGQGFSQIKRHLFKDLQDMTKRQQNIILLKHISARISTGLMRQSSQIADRSVHVLEELLEQSSDIVSEAMNQENLVFSLITIAIFKRVVTLHPQAWDNIKCRICGIFLFWWQKYSKEQRDYHHLIFGYRELRNRNIQFPSETNIREKKKKVINQKQAQQEQNKMKAMGEVLEQIAILIETAEVKVKNNPNQMMNKQSVRMLKYKNKYLYDLSTSKMKFSNQEKVKIGSLYKRIRAVLKVIEAKNDRIVKNNQAVDQQKYIKEKIESMSISPNKKRETQQQSFSLLDQENTKGAQDKTALEKSPIKIVKNTKNEDIYVGQMDLLDIGPPSKKDSQKIDMKKNQGTPKKIIQIDILSETLAYSQNQNKTLSPEKIIYPEKIISAEKVFESPAKLKDKQPQYNEVGFCYQDYNMDIMSNSSSSPRKQQNPKTPVKQKNDSSGSKRDFMGQIDDLMSPLSNKSKDKKAHSQKKIQIIQKNQQFGEFVKSNSNKQEDLI